MTQEEDEKEEDRERKQGETVLSTQFVLGLGQTALH